MFNTVILDLDEKNILGIRSYILKSFKSFKVEKAFTIEKDFLKYVKNNKINLIIMEIRFFGIDTIHKLEDFSKQYPDIKIIVYGNLTDFPYLKKAIDIGAISYAIRPVKPSDLKKCLTSYIEYTKIVETMEKEKKMLDIEYLQNFKLFEDKFLSVLVNESVFDDKEIEMSFKYFDINIESPHSIAIFRIDSFRKYILNKSQKEKHIISMKISKIINNNIKNCKTFINLFNEVVVILGGKYKYNAIFELLKDIIFQIKDEIGISVSCGVGRLYEHYTDMHTSFLEAITALRYRCIVGYNSVIFIDDVEPENVFTSRYPYEIERKLVYTAVIGDYDYCILLLDNIFREINHFKEKFEKILPQIIMSILISINRNAFEQGLDIKPINRFFDTEEVLNLKKTEDAYQLLKAGLLEFCEYIQKFRKDGENVIFDKATTYIDKHYMKHITYKSLAKEIDYNPKYLRKIFEEKTNTTIDLFIMCVRIEKAKELIINTNLTDDIIALKIGYDDVHTFRQTFKKTTGFLAGDFRYAKRDISKK